MGPIKTRRPFQVSYNSSVQYGYDEGRPPSSAQLVAMVSWGWAPGHDRCECYVICTDRKRTRWTLWAKAYNEADGRLMYAKLAYGSPFGGYPAKFAAEKLLIAAWHGERQGYGSDLRGAHVDREGLLTKDDIERIEHEVFGDLDPTPDTVVEWTVWSDEHEHWHCLFRGSLRDACVKYGLELEAALKELKYGSSLRGPGDVVLRKAYKT